MFIKLISTLFCVVKINIAASFHVVNNSGGRGFVFGHQDGEALFNVVREPDNILGVLQAEIMAARKAISIGYNIGMGLCS
jgi:hypothetical protein